MNVAAMASILPGRIAWVTLISRPGCQPEVARLSL